MAKAAAKATTPDTETTEKDTTDMAKKPAMAGNTEFKFEVIEGKEADIPVTVRAGTNRLPFPFDNMKAGDKFLVPGSFWVSRGITKDKNTPALNKDRIRRSFYSWQGDKEDRKKLVLAFSTQMDGKTYSGEMVYMAKKPG